MASALTRVERSAPIFMRVTGLIRSGQMKWEDRPLWYDVYAAIPPFEEPVWDIKFPKADQPVRKIFYPEDKIRAEFYKKFRSAGIIQIDGNKPSVSQLFVDQFNQLKAEDSTLSDDAVFEKAASILEENGFLRRGKRPAPAVADASQ